ncbi:hypothetical protein ONZ45_g11831 [Pleurotus djamor]|nr:hypothetical protein ONZ45_g11831 [Pleurotus djamor]
MVSQTIVDNDENASPANTSDPVTVNASIPNPNGALPTSQLDTYLQQVYSVDRLLSRHLYGRHIEGFREMQALTGLIISGSSVLNFLTLEADNTSDIDLYVPITGGEYVGAWLQRIGCIPHYKNQRISFFRTLQEKLRGVLNLTLSDLRSHTPQALLQDIPLTPPRPSVYASILSDSNPYQSRQILTVVDFLSPKKTKIQLVICVGTVIDALLSFHSSHVMNFATAHACYCLFPEETIGLKTSLKFPNQNPRTVEAYKKYRSRERHVGDRHTLITPLSPPLKDLSSEFDEMYRSTRFSVDFSDLFMGSPYIEHTSTFFDCLYKPAMTRGLPDDDIRSPTHSPNTKKTSSPPPQDVVTGTWKCEDEAVGYTSVASLPSLTTVDALNDHVWSLERCLKAHFPRQSVPFFRVIQATSGMIVSGHTALQFIDMVHEPGRVLDLYVNVKTSLTAGIGLENLGCTAVTRTGEPTTFIDCLRTANNMVGLRNSLISQDIGFSHITDEERCPQYIVRDDGLGYANGLSRYPNQVIYTVVTFIGPMNTKIDLVISLCSVAALVTLFHSTLLMNIITPKSCICLFPNETIYKRTGLTIQSRTVFQSDVRKKCLVRGYEMLATRKDASEAGLFAPGRRSSHNSNILYIPLHPIIDTLATPFDDEFDRAVYDLTFTGSPFTNAKLSYVGLSSSASEDINLREVVKELEDEEMDKAAVL